MRLAHWGILVLILLPILQCPASSPAAASEASAELQLIELMPRFPSEYIGLENIGHADVDLRGWSLTDGEGSWAFASSLVLEPGRQAFLCSNLTFITALHDGAVAIDPASLSRKGRMALADDGDEVSLLDPQARVADKVCWGASALGGEGWMGAACPSPSEGKALHRYLPGPGSDSDCRSDWVEISPGRFPLAPVSDLASVEPFLCPEQMRQRIVREVAFAQEAIEAEVYELSDGEVASWLAEAARRGVRVRLLVEGRPVGGLPPTEAGVLAALQESGCEVRTSHPWHGFKRYDYLHCKYLVADGRRVTLTSENWAFSSLDSNRGWGASVQSEALAMAFREVFEADFSRALPDTRTFLAPPLTPLHRLDRSPVYEQPTGLCSFMAKATTVLTPGDGLEQVLGLIDAAQRRLVLQLFYASKEWPEGRSPIQAAVEAARRGVSVRVLLDANWYNSEGGKGNALLAQELVRIANLEGLDLEAKLIDAHHGYGALHNKGLVADDATLVSSINWVYAAFHQNREAALIIESAQVSDFFVRAFEQDWTDDVAPPELEVPGSLRVREGQSLVVTANASDPSGVSSIIWDVGGDGSEEARGGFLAIQLGPGQHRIVVTACDAFNNSISREILVDVVPAERAPAYLLPATAGAGACLLAIILRKRVKLR